MLNEPVSPDPTPDPTAAAAFGVPIDAAAFGSPRIVVEPMLPDGQVVILRGGTIMIGTCPLTPIQAAGREARLIVRRGMAEVLTWLGEPVYTEPTSAEILDSLRRLRH